MPNLYGNNPLIQAVCASAYISRSKRNYENENIIKYLIENSGANVNEKNNDGVSPLAGCCQFGNDRVVNYLISKGADLNARDATQSKYPLHFATAMGHVNVIKALLDAGADVNITDCYGFTPLRWSQNESVSKFLLDNGATPNPFQ